MPRMTPDFSRYVNARWLPFLVEHVLRTSPTLQPLTLNDFDTAALESFNYRGVVKVTALAHQIAKRDRGGESEANWVRMIRRWINENRAPEPETIRRVLDSLGFDWLIGLGRSGYKQHAIAMLHVLNCRMGGQSRVVAQARAIFTGSDYERNNVGDRSLWAFKATAAPSERKSDVPHLRRLHRAAEECWGSGRTIPTRCTPPHDLPASRLLYVAWMLLDHASSSRSGSLETRLRAIDESVVREVQAWANAIAPREPTLTRVSSDNRKKGTI